jgi:predicted RNA-binding Zn ribbon-like protein
MTNASDFDFDAGQLSLDFANTAEMHASDNPDELLRDFDDVVTWGLAAGILSSGSVNGLRQFAQEQPEEAWAAYERALKLREAIYQIFSYRSREVEAEQDDLETLNQILSAALPHLQVTPSPSGFDWEWEQNLEASDQIIWQVAHSAAELLTSKQLDRVRECADERGCGYLFLDTSRNRSRRWCSMESCGNRAKASRHYKKIRDAG